MKKNDTKYRIKKVERIDGNGKSEVKFLVQKKIWFFWKLYYELGYGGIIDGHTYLPERHIPVETYDFVKFNKYKSVWGTEEDAIACIKRLKRNPNKEFVENFMHQHIVKIDNWFVNASRYEFFEWEKYYEIASTLEELERKIKSRKIKKHVTILNYEDNDK